MINFSSEVFLEEMEKGLGSEGDLILMIGCTKCNANFELNKESVAMAIATSTTFIEYLRWIQSSKCTKCNTEKLGISYGTI